MEGEEDLRGLEGRLGAVGAGLHDDQRQPERLEPKRPAGQPCCEPVVHPDVERAQAERLAGVAKALGDPIRLQLIDVLRKHAGKVCVCELTPLFDVSQPTVSHHLKLLREAGLVDSERRGLWAYYYVLPERLAELGTWVGGPAADLGATC